MRSLRTLAGALLCALALAALTSSTASAAQFGLDLGVTSTAEDGSPEVQAGSHPFALTTQIDVETEENPPGSGTFAPVEEAKDVRISVPPGLVGSPTAVPRCAAAEFLASDCPDASAIGTARVEYGVPDPLFQTVPVYNLYPAYGSAGKIGFMVEGLAVAVVDLGLNPNPPYNVVVNSTNLTQGVPVLGADVKLWGVPADPAHDNERGKCALSHATCEVSVAEKPFLTLPTDCSAPLTFGFEANSWQNPVVPYPFKGTATISDGAIPPNPLSPSGCAKLQFSPQLTTQPTQSSAESPSGLDVDVDVEDEGIQNPDGYAASTVKKAVVTLPEGVTINPSQAEGLGTCSQAQLAAERADSLAGEGCPSSSKIGTVEVESPLLEGVIFKGGLFVATPYENPSGSLIALYIVFRDPELGILVKLAGKVEPDPQTGQLIATFDDLPQLPFSRFHLHFREGGRSPLVTPPACGTYTTQATFTPWSNPAAPYTTTSSFSVTSGVGGGACPPAGVPPFSPGFSAGSLSNSAGSYSPVNMRLTRNDGEQDITRFSTIFPPGLVAKIAGVPTCSDAAIAAAKTRTGLEEKASPSCPADSQIGRVLAGAGVGGELTYVPGQIYLAGPYNGAPLSVAVITPAVAGPFDVGTVVVRVGLNLNPNTGEAEVDGSASDPIPHILAGIPLKLRDLRVYVDRQNFTLNPTNCEPLSFRATVFGGYLDVFSSADDVAVYPTQRFQAVDCANLAYKPKLTLNLKGGTKRGAHPALSSVLTPRAGDANTGRAVVVLPPSEQIDNAHINNPCTRVQFNANECPASSVLGTVRAFTPLLDQPLEGKVYFRSNGGERLLPDIVADLKGQFRIVLVGAVDTLTPKTNPRLRTTFATPPDAPVSKFVIKLDGGKKGLLVNNRNLCTRTLRAKLRLTGQNGRAFEAEPKVGTSCKK